MRCTPFAVFLLLCATAQGESSTVELKDLSVEELLSLEVTTVSRQGSTVGQSPAAVFVITQDDIRRSGATTIAELLRRVPGMNVARIDGNKWAIGARGLNDRFQRFLLAQIDGRTIYSATFAGVYWDAVDYPLENIERIEVIRGPGASVWGANAVNGIVNIITKSAAHTHGALLVAGGGDEERGFGTFRYGGDANDTLDYRIHGKASARDEQFFAGGGSHDGWTNASVGLRLDWKANDRDVVTVDAGGVRSDAARRDLRPMLAAPFVLANFEDEVSKATHVLARWSHTRDAESDWSLQIYWDSFTRIFENLEVHQRWDTYDVDFQHRLALGERNRLIWGLGYRAVESTLSNSGLDNGFILSYVPSDSRQQLAGAFLQDQIALVPDRLNLTIGSKFEHNDFTGFEYQPTVRLLWMSTTRQSVWAAVSRAVRTPSVADDELRSTLLQSTPGVVPYPQTTGNPGIESEELLAFELGYRTQATAAFSLDLASFYNEYHGLRVQVPGTVFTNALGAEIRPLLRDNRMVGEIYGVELAARWQAAATWRLYGAYTFLKTSLHADAALPAGTRIGAEAAVGQSPEQQVYLQSGWDLPRGIELDLIGRFVDRLKGFNPSGAAGVSDTIAAYVSLDARVAWRPSEDLELSIVGQNLLDDHRSQFGTSAAVRSPQVEIERAVYAKLTIAW